MNKFVAEEVDKALSHTSASFIGASTLLHVEPPWLQWVCIPPVALVVVVCCRGFGGTKFRSDYSIPTYYVLALIMVLSYDRPLGIVIARFVCAFLRICLELYHLIC